MLNFFNAEAETEHFSLTLSSKFIVYQSESESTEPNKANNEDNGNDKKLDLFYIVLHEFQFFQNRMQSVEFFSAKKTASYSYQASGLVSFSYPIKRR